MLSTWNDNKYIYYSTQTNAKITEHNLIQHAFLTSKTIVCHFILK